MATRVFALGFSFTRSITHPFLARELQPGVWRLHDAARRSGDPRCEEFIGVDLDVTELDSIARREAQGRYRVCAILSDGTPDVELRERFRSLRYRLIATEAFMVHPLEEIPSVPEPFPVQQVTCVEQAEALAKALGRRQILPEHLTAKPPPMRQYIALDGTSHVGWVGCVAAAGCGWCTNMGVAEPYRRRGIARSLMVRMLRDDRAAGACHNVLLASHSGSKLYPTVGYRQIATLYLYTPPRAAGAPA
jgi:GNAT superfamily N-acetyltransferase